MTRQIFKRLLNQRLMAAIALLMSCFLAAPLTSTAIGTHTATVKAAKVSAFCTNLPTKTSKLQTDLVAEQAKATQTWQQQDQKLQAAAQKTDARVVTTRQHADSQRALRFQKLEAKATTATQKQAVQSYETSVRAAVTTRRASYDTARQTYRDSVTSAVTSRRSAVSGSFTTYNTAVASAITTAAASCGTTTDTGAAKTALQSSLQTARTNYQTTRHGAPQVSTQVKQLVAARQASFQQADATHKASLQTARLALEQVFGQSATANL